MFQKLEPMFVIKRDGKKEIVYFDKITNRLKKLMYDIDNIDPVLITQKLCSRIVSGITTTELDNLASQICMSIITDNPNYGILGARIAISNHQKNTDDNFLLVLDKLRNNKDIHNELSPMVNEEIFSLASKYEKEINKMIDYNRDYLIDFFGFKTLEKSYLLRINKKPVERPQHLFMRVALAIHGDDLTNVKKTYDNLSLKNYTHATPTLFNAGCPNQQLSSCYLLATDDSVEGIFGTITDCAKISKWSGGIGIHVSNIRANGSYIRKTAGYSDGIMPMLKVYNDVARYINQGGGKRNGSFAMYIEPWHADIFAFLDAKKNHGSEELRARDLFYALWIPDLFMKAIEENGDWYLMCPDKCPKLPDVYGEEFDRLYLKYVEENKYNKKIKARELWDAIISSQIETGTPYMLYKDAANKKSNQKNIDTIKSSNLCVAGDTMILTKEGYYSIEELKNKDIEVWNGKEWSNTTVKKTGSNQKLINIEFSNGMNLKCTEYHKFYIETSSRPGNKSVPIVVEAKNLEKNMRIIRYDFDQTTDNNNELKYSYTHGLFCADGTKSTNKSQHRCHYKRQEGKYFCGRHLSHIKDYDIEDGICCANSYSDKPMLPLYGEKIKLLDHIDKISHGEYIEKQNKINVSLPYDIKEKYYVPINNSINSKIRWLEGYFDGDSCIIENDGLKNIQYCSNNLKFMRDILLLLQTLGISSQIKVGKKEKKTLLPDGKGGNKYYDTKIIYRSSIDSIGLNKLIKLGFSPKRLNIENTRLPHHVTNMFIKVENILDKNEYGDTYCFNEPLEHKGIFNGILTGQCAEIVEVSNKDETSVCNLASICLPSILEYPNKSYHDWYDLLAHKEKQLSEYYFKGQLKLLSEKDCVYCKLLKALLKENGLEYEEISNETAEELSQYCARPIPDKFTTIPQLFSIMEDGEIDEVKHLGGYTNTWNLLSPRVNHNKLYELSYDLTVNLNKIIDKNYYPTEKTKVSNLRHRPIGIGVQGLADLFLSLKIPFDSPEARKINKEIFETMYFAALYSSHDIALKEGSYSTFSGSPISEGIFQFNMWGLKVEDLSGRWDWDFLRKNIMTNGIRNSLLIALMPTASTSQIMGSYVECFEPLTSNLYTRRTLAGEFVIINPYLIKDLINLDMWNNDVKNRLQYDKGSVKNIKNFPFKDIYRTVWEIPQKSLLEMSADRGIFVCQSQSLNLFFEKPEYKKLSMAHLAGWKLGLKTGSYYIRSKPATSAQRFAMDPDIEKKLKDEDLQNKEEIECLNCGA